MIKVETLGQKVIEKNCPVLTSASDVENYSFITIDGIMYLIANEDAGDNAYVNCGTIKAGEYLNGYVVEAWKDQKLVIDGKHIQGGVASLAKNAVLVADTDGTLKTGSAPSAGVYFKVSDINITLTEAAVKVVVCVA